MFRLITSLEQEIKTEISNKVLGTESICLDSETNSLDTFQANWILLQLKI
jgi:hypothetical protein